MYLYNISFFVEHDVHDRWLELVRDKFIPLLTANGCSRVRFCRVLRDGHPSEGATYALMVECPGMEEYRRLAGELFDEYRTVAQPLFGDRVQWFATLLKDVQ
ncbi:MAG: DUF4286 family protein [Alistipes sp.]|nr:DUF4286 family protein [Alistipes sp.]